MPIKPLSLLWCTQYGGAGLGRTSGTSCREIVHPLNHRHVTFTVPKLLGGYLCRNRRLSTMLLCNALQARHEYLCELMQIRDGLSGGIFYMQTHDSLQM